MQRVQQRDTDVNHDDREGDHTQARAEHLPPALPRLRVVAQAVEKRGEHDDQHEYQRVGPQQDRFYPELAHQLSRTLGSAHV